MASPFAVEGKGTIQHMLLLLLLPLLLAWLAHVLWRYFTAAQ